MSPDKRSYRQQLLDWFQIAESLIEAGLVQRRWGMPGRTDTMQLSASFVGKVIIEYSGIEDFDVILMVLGDGK
jgi:hypothetical protein